LYQLHHDGADIVAADGNLTCCSCAKAYAVQKSAVSRVISFFIRLFYVNNRIFHIPLHTWKKKT
jgi:hypothetical protein